MIDPVTGLPVPGITQTDAMGTDYWGYENGGTITLAVGRNAGKFSSGKWTTADTGAWDYFSAIETTSAYYGLFSANYDSGVAGLAAMGGGGLLVRTGGDFLAQAGTFGAGDLSIYSNGDVKGRFLSSDGQGEIHAAGNFGSFDHRTQLELCNSGMNVTARGELQIGAVLNPALSSDTLLPPQYIGARDSSFVQCTYTPATSIKLEAGTDVTLAGISPYYANNPNQQITTPSEKVLPANVSMSAQGNIFLLNDFTMASAPTGNLSIKAGGALKGYSTDTNGYGSILMSDISTQNWYGLFDRTHEQGNRWITIRTWSQNSPSNNHGLYDPVGNTWDYTAPLHIQDAQPVLVQAGGDISTLRLMFPKQADVTAGTDIRDIIYEGQNLNASDASLIRAGNDIIMKYVKAVAGTGGVPPADNGPHNGLIQGGPGVFMVQAGGSIDLGSLKDGIQAIGNGNNMNLDSTKSSLVILSGYGFNKSAADIDAFFTTLRTAGDHYAQLMAAGMLDDAAQLLQTTRQAAIDPLLGSPTGAGDVNMTSSQIATSMGQSDIFVIANGSLNLGQTALPTPGVAPKATGITTGGGGAINMFSRLDMNVNESRVMTFYGGDITLWSDQGNINAGRGSRTAVSALPPRKVKTPQGLYVTVFSPPAVGSGIRAVTYGDSPPPPGNIHLFAPRGIIDAGEAGIAGGQITLAALKVNNASNITFSAGSIGMPQATEGAASLGTLGGSGIPSQNTQMGGDVSGIGTSRAQASQMVEDIIAKWLEVKVIDFVDDEPKEE